MLKLSTDLEEILAKHKVWVQSPQEGARANFSGMDLSGVNFRERNLAGADFSFARVHRADFSRARLTAANFHEAEAQGACFKGALLDHGNFHRAWLNGAQMSHASMSHAKLLGAGLLAANLEESNLVGAHFSGALMAGANLRGAALPHFQICPQTGAFHGFKKARGVYILELLIPAGAARTSALTSRKCRASRVKVLTATTLAGDPAPHQEYASNYDSTFIYKVGKFVRVKNYSDDIRETCAPGIHFFMTREEAVGYPGA